MFFRMIDQLLSPTGLLGRIFFLTGAFFMLTVLAVVVGSILEGNVLGFDIAFIIGIIALISWKMMKWGARIIAAGRRIRDESEES